jgi:hypothetical protein
MSSDAASSAIRFLERIASKTKPAPLPRLGLDRDSIRRALARTVPATPSEIRRTAAGAHPKARTGRRGLPDYVLAAMYSDYQQHHSLAKTAALYRRTRQSLWEIFHRHGLAMEPLKRLDKVLWNGRAFTPGKDDYLRETTGAREMLHHAIWKAAHGPIPPGHQVTFRNAHSRDFRLDNLACLPLAEVTRMHSAGHNQFTRRPRRAAAA